MEDPLVEEENKFERHFKAIRRIESDELANRRWQEDLAESRKPYWLREDADYLPEDSGMNVGDLDEL